jgi:HPt (histidine-containing phosphotransfer) domain-containing protein
MAADGGKIIVKVDEDIEDLIPEYLDMTKEDVASLKAALESGDYEALRIKGHTLKGSGGGYGFDEISVIGGKIEEYAKTKAHAEIVKLTAELESYLDRVEVVFE